jgi:magnesium transporter
MVPASVRPAAPSQSATPQATNDHLDEPVLAHLRRDVMTLSASMTVAEALESIRRGSVGERIVYFYVVDGDGKLAGVLPVRRLLMSAADAPIADLMVRRVVTVPHTATLMDACEVFVLHRFLAVPVVDGDGRPLGQIDVSVFADEVLDLSERQASDDLFQLIGIHMAASRSASPLRNFAGGILAAGIASIYEAFLDTVIVLALFIPVVLALAESVSIQSMTITLQALHGRGRTTGDTGRALVREALVALLLGIACGALVGFIAWLWKGQPLVAVAIAASIALSMLTASLLGVALPRTMRAFALDPRIASGPIVLALADLATLLFYFNLAGFLLST